MQLRRSMTSLRATPEKGDPPGWWEAGMGPSWVGELRGKPQDTHGHEATCLRRGGGGWCGSGHRWGSGHRGFRPVEGHRVVLSGCQGL
eukprot:13581793-Alexandrium_andersonii.AAC.1